MHAADVIFLFLVFLVLASIVARGGRSLRQARDATKPAKCPYLRQGGCVAGQQNWQTPHTLETGFVERVCAQSFVTCPTYAAVTAAKSRTDP